MNLQGLLPQLVLEAIGWAKAQALYVARSGKPLTERGLALARQVGVKNPELVRLLYVDQLPVPVKQLALRQMILEEKLFEGRAGLTLGHSIMIVHGEGDSRLVSHELRHVHQYEALGGIEGFMPRYLAEIDSFGYDEAPLEVDARAHEVSWPMDSWA
ncbi:MAG: hypothetical protein Q7V20_23690 [Aquabacterium sp.]|uniref:hypothetical protein n=1 Tax=Aquabacterium sp. TaxID=1872578 RepID=UPI002722EB20|nr:hypothetical protein [Aquabacterium sp.]MDO9006457.1 hypothetical protein [Aquabacterium sp.]